jgi:hypothetical protein
MGKYFVEKNLSFDPSYIFDDVLKAIKYVHAGPIHEDIMANLPLYLNKQPALIEFLIKLKKANKQVRILFECKIC